MLKTAIVEDDESYREELSSYVKRYAAESGQDIQIFIYGDGSAILKEYEPKYDIILLDIEMPEINGMETARRIRQGEKPILQGDGLQTRDFIYVEDTVRALLLTYEREESRGQIINIGSGEGIAIRDLLDRICAYMGYQGEWEMEQARNSDVHDLCASSALARKLLGFAPKVGFDEGIRRTLDWYLGQG